MLSIFTENIPLLFFSFDKSISTRPSISINLPLTFLAKKSESSKFTNPTELLTIPKH